LTAERSATFDSNAIHCRRRRHGRLLYVALQLTIAGTWPALDGRVEMWRWVASQRVV